MRGVMFEMQKATATKTQFVALIDGARGQGGAADPKF